MKENFSVIIKTTGKPMNIGKENLLMAFKKSEKSNLIKSQGLSFAANEFAVNFCKNFVFKDEEAPAHKIFLLIKDSFPSWNNAKAS